MAVRLRQSTAVTVPVGPFMDSVDGDTEEIGLTISQTDVRISKNNGLFGQKNDAGAATHDEKAWYRVPLDTTDTDTTGPFIVNIHEAGALVAWREFEVVPQHIYDSEVAGTDTRQVDVTEVQGSPILTLSGGRVQAHVGGFDQDVLTSTALADTAGEEIADKVWDELRSGHTTAGTFGEGVKAESLNTQAKADVNAEVVDVVATDTIPELAQGQPASTPTLQEAVMLPYMRIRNKLTESATEEQIHNAAATVIAKATLSEDGTTFTKSVLTTGP